MSKEGQQPELEIKKLSFCFFGCDHDGWNQESGTSSSEGQCEMKGAPERSVGGQREIVFRRGLAIVSAEGC